MRKALAQWGMVPYPPTVEKIEMVAAVLKEGEYRSASSYLGQYRADSERAGCEVTGPLQRAFKDMTRSCNRGLGPGAKSMGLPLPRLRELPQARQPWVPGGPICPRTALVAGSWFLTREVVLATSRACLVTVVEGTPATVSWSLPASKSDLRAEGVERTHLGGRIGVADPGCPVCALRDHLRFLRRAFPQAWAGSSFILDSPLFPTVRLSAARAGSEEGGSGRARAGTA